MRYRVPQAVFSDRRLPGRSIAVLMALWEHADEKGYCWPSQGRIGRLTGIDRPDVCKIIGGLEALGYLVRAGRRHRACQYFLTVPTSCGEDATQSCGTDATQPLQGTRTPPIVPPRGDVAASADADKSPERRRERRRERGGGQEAATPPPDPRPSDRGGGALVPADMAGAANALARQAGRRMNRTTALPRGPPDPVMTAVKHLSRDRWTELVERSLELRDPGAACIEAGLTREGKPKCHD